MNLHLPVQIDRDELIFYLWNAGTEPVYFDDLRIIKKYK
jgi:hypothetical protein